MSIETENLLQAEDSNEKVEIDGSLSSVEPPRQEEKETFASFGVHHEIVSSLSEAGILHPFPIQAMTLPIALTGHDIIGQAKTGTGKTLGFGIPALNRIVAPKDEGFDKLAAPGAPQAMIIVPTRELAVQVAGDLVTASKHRGIRIATIYGGRAYEPQIEALQKGVELIVGTPGRLIDLLKQRHLNVKHVRIVILDEADEMLDLGFLPDVETLISGTPAVRQTMLFSATMPGPVVAMARRYMTQPTHIRAADPDDEGLTKRDIRQLIYRAHNLDKIEVVARILQANGRGRSIIFTKTKRTAAKVAEELVDRGFAAAAIHGDLGQGAREQALRAFRNNKVDVLVATDVAARGIDVDDVTHVVNYQCVEDEKIYLHRVGRTGRAGNKGTAVTFVDWDDMPRWGLINKALGLSVPEPVETYSSSPHLYTDLDIPAGTKGRLPRNKRTHEGINAETLEDLGETGKRNSPKTGGRDSSREGERSGNQGGNRSGASRGGNRGGNRSGAHHGEKRRDDTQSASRTENQTGENTTGEQAQGKPAQGGRSRRRPSGDSTASTTQVDGGAAETKAPRRSRTRRRNGEVIAKAANGE
ncbi:DEAD/DEAH box helicase [Arthrobacter antibioticus]|uniref:DEAD/DEAH box helicase n=1 Tax=Arthrobacter sp. H35-MC1 TaxID=3046203 RepID=UPI0024BAC080|nr:DEAD/DEAH box helicase [Arthrobacter sp. H35-MC1]MDJ0317566.1 DEAD/DEAH box helicase [Arthrobacter sp. H35-MC1]